MASLTRILLVEDSQQDAEMMLAALNEHNLASGVAVTRDGIEALDYLHCRGKFAERHHELPAVVFLDLKMPRMNGLEVLASIKSDSALKTIPVVMLTSSREELDLIKSYELGVNAYVVKPVDFKQFMDSIKSLGFFWAIVNEKPPRVEG